MANPTRILFVSDEVAPFTDHSDIAKIVRSLPEHLQESGDFEVRILMPRYGTISERRNRLHEVIRLSGTEVTIGDRTETLKCKVASIPGIRLQVYFMDNKHYFKRKGIYADKQGKLFEDNAERALFFSQAALETIRNLGWKPDIVHAFGWLSGMVPLLLKTRFADDSIYENVKVFYTPNKVTFDATVTPELAQAASVDADQVAGLSSAEIGSQHADAVILPPSLGDETGAASFSEDQSEWPSQATSIYDSVSDEVAA